MWKKSKDGEPFWPSPWGNGRPGWHIECSAMSSNFFKICPIDIHAGGCDLKFPHHDNEMAQSEAYYNSKEWVRYFMHSGHLEIRGRKMSKSLKNFVTIREALTKFNGRQVRMMVLMHKWDASFNYSEQSMPEAVEVERQIYEFFLNMKALTREVTFSNVSQKWDDIDHGIYKVLNETRTKIHSALCDSFDTPLAMRHLQDLISATNQYLKTAPIIKKSVVDKISSYVKYILSSFGILDENAIYSQNSTELEKSVTPYLNALCKFRDDIKENARTPGIIFEKCDKLRDEVMPELGVRIEDFALGKPSVWKFEDKEKLKTDIKKKLDEKSRKNAIKQAEEQRKMLAPEEYFKKLFKSQYSQFDKLGIPTHDSNSKKLNPEVIRKLKKEYRIQQRLYNKWKSESIKNA